MQRSLNRLTERVFDLLIIGGGITGAGVALDAVTRGLSVALIDQGDFASGTSSASSKLIHGGLRYLELGEFRLVFEALHERRRLLHNAPHLVRPLRFVVPFYRGSRLPMWKGRAGLLAYDLLAGPRNLRRSQSLSLSRLRRECPTLQRVGLVGGADYFDALMDDARLNVEVVRTAAAHGAVVANYVRAVGLDCSQRPACATVRDRAPGGGSETFVIQAREVLNATGPWADAVRQLADASVKPCLQPTKGVHVLLPGRGWSSAFLLLHPHDGRVFFVIPWLNRTLLGTTDTFAETRPDELTVTAEEEEYLLSGYNHYFTNPMARGDILGRFAGLRPLLRGDATNPSARSRDYAILEGPDRLISVVGGKYTTYRSMAEAVTDRIAARLGVTHRCRTRRLRLDGTPRQAWPAFERTETLALERAGLEQSVARHLVQRYGRRAGDVARVLLRDAALCQPVVPGEPDTIGEWQYQRDHEMALCPADHWLRRSRLGLFAAGQPSGL